MKSIKLILSVIVIVFVALMACSSEAESAAQEKHYPQMTVVCENYRGIVFKYKDGKNTIYVYERNNAGGGITVIGAN